MNEDQEKLAKDLDNVIDILDETAFVLSLNECQALIKLLEHEWIDRRNELANSVINRMTDFIIKSK